MNKKNALLSATIAGLVAGLALTGATPAMAKHTKAHAKKHAKKKGDANKCKAGMKCKGEAPAEGHDAKGAEHAAPPAETH